MKKTLIALLALTGIATATPLTLSAKTVSYGSSATLTTGNQAMTWDDASGVYTNWYMTFSFTELADKSTTIGSRWVSTICTDSSSNPRKGLAASVSLVGTGRSPQITFGTGGEFYSDALGTRPTLGFSANDTLTMAVYEDYAYLGNQNSKEYVSIKLSDLTFATGSDSKMTSGGARAFANSDSTKIGETTIASLDNLPIPNGEILDITKLVTTGVAMTRSVPEPTTATLSLLALAGLAARRRRR